MDLQKHVSQVIAEFSAADLKINDNEMIEVYKEFYDGVRSDMKKYYGEKK